MRAAALLLLGFFPAMFLLRLNLETSALVPWSALAVALYLLLVLQLLAPKEIPLLALPRASQISTALYVTIAGLCAAVGVELLWISRTTIDLSAPYFVQKLGVRGSIVHMLTYVVSGALVEEMTFRGIAQSALRIRFGAFNSIAISSVLFTAWHIGNEGLWAVWPFLLVFGMSLGLAVEASGNLVTNVIVHASYNYAMGILPMFVPVTLGAATRTRELVLSAALLLAALCIIWPCRRVLRCCMVSEP